MKKLRLIFFIVSALTLMAVRVFCYQGEVEDISGSKYFPAVIRAISDAKESISF